MKKLIEVNNLSKEYMISHLSSKDTFREYIVNCFKDLSSGKAFKKKFEKETFLALNDVSFSLEEGERVGIIGRNGAGKSTLLKLLARITEPTRGSIRLSGRVASLLEVGTGFHPELTGRENIYLNGSILGMKRSEIKTKFDEIVAFSEVEKFLDTPVKRYSSGMYVRLAFSVAAHLEPEVLIVDEVLAVGDLRFQQKCLGKMNDVSKEGRTILFVSHNMAAIENLCTRCIYLESGQLIEDGSTLKVIQHYVSSGKKNGGTDLSNRVDRKGTGTIILKSIELKNKTEGLLNCLQTGSSCSIVITFLNTTPTDKSNVNIAIGIDNMMGQRIAHLSTDIVGQTIEISGRKEKSLGFYFNKLQLSAGTYSIVLFCTENGDVSDWIQDAYRFDVVDGDYYGHGKVIPNGQSDILLDYKIAEIECNI